MELLAAVAIVAAIGAIVGYGTSGRRARVERFAIADAPEGRRLRVVGKILDRADALTAPASGRRCVYYAFVIEREHVVRRLGAGDERRWQAVYRDVQGDAFAISDGGGRALVDPAGAELDLDRPASVERGPVDRASPRVRALMNQQAIPAAGLLAGPARYREAALVVGETIGVIGAAVREPDPAAIAEVTGYREGPPTRLRLGGAPGHPLVIGDTPALLA